MNSWSWSRSGSGFWLQVIVTSPHAADVVVQCVSISVRVCVDVFRQNGLCISTLVSSLSPLFYPITASPPVLLSGQQRAVSEACMHWTVCSIVCAVSVCLCLALSQYLFSLITMGTSCGCLDGFFLLLFWVAFCSVAQVFVFRHRLSVLHLCHCVNGRAVGLSEQPHHERQVGPEGCVDFILHCNVSPIFLSELFIYRKFFFTYCTNNI